MLFRGYDKNTKSVQRYEDIWGRVKMNSTVQFTLDTVRGKMWAQFAFPVYIFSLVGAIVLVAIGRYSTLVSRLCSIGVFPIATPFRCSNGIRTVLVLRSFSSTIVILISLSFSSLVPRPRFPTAAGGLHHRYGVWEIRTDVYYVMTLT